MKEEYIIKELQEIGREQEEVDNKANRLAEHVLAHFNEYVRDVINPSLPGGYDLLDVEEAKFHSVENGYIVKTGAVRTLTRGIITSCVVFDEEIVTMCKKYTDETPWIFYITYGFDLPVTE